MVLANSLNQALEHLHREIDIHVRALTSPAGSFTCLAGSAFLSAARLSAVTCLYCRHSTPSRKLADHIARIGGQHTGLGVPGQQKCTVGGHGPGKRTSWQAALLVHCRLPKNFLQDLRSPGPGFV